MKFKLQQWEVNTGGTWQTLFTPYCDAETAMAIAVATFGYVVTEIKDNGMFQQSLTNAQLHAADSDWCPVCGQWQVHEEGCEQA